jgi:hypothetical protein
MTRAARSPEKKVETRRFRRFFADLGPGLITGAADDDPSGISTYSVAGATLGYAPLWTALFSFPLMSAVQLMCARLGLVTGLGLAGVIRRRYSRWVFSSSPTSSTSPPISAAWPTRRRWPPARRWRSACRCMARRSSRC